ncbi:MAG: SH3 domain-containing protein [Thermodesulfobacteriota bacterium]
MRKPAHAMKSMKYLLALGFVLTLLMTGTGWGEVLKVAQPSQSLYPDPDFASTPIASVPQGTEVNVERQVGDWYKVEFEGKTGWLNRQAFGQPQAASKLNLPGLLLGSPVKQTSSDEVALAGKGFTPEVENSYRSKHPEMNFAQVDKIEAFTVPPAKLQAFIKEGDLKP